MYLISMTSNSIISADSGMCFTDHELNSTVLTETDAWPFTVFST